eukprot:2876777-Amphidinium_carterae.1
MHRSMLEWGKHYRPICKTFSNWCNHRFVVLSSRRQFAIDSGKCCSVGSDCKHSGKQTFNAFLASGLSERRR